MEREVSRRGEGGSSFSQRRMRARGAASNMGMGSRTGDGGKEVGEEGLIVKEEDWFMPMTNLIRIMRRVLPGHAKISDDAKETIQDCVTEYISIVTSEANQRCQLEQRKTITADDVLWAMRKLGLDDYVEPLSMYLRKFREVEHMSTVRPVIRKELAGPMNGAGRGFFLQPPHHIQQLPHAIHGGGKVVGEGSSSGVGGGTFYNDFENTDGRGRGSLF